MPGSAEPRPANCAMMEPVKSLSGSSTMRLPGVADKNHQTESLHSPDRREYLGSA
jgi:hypothetical protein